MTRLHKFYFFFWYLYTEFLGLRVGKYVYEEVGESGRFIRGIITSKTGDSINNKRYSFGINIKMEHPTQGSDPRFYVDALGLSPSCFRRKNNILQVKMGWAIEKDGWD